MTGTASLNMCPEGVPAAAAASKELTGELDKASATPAVCITSLKLSENQLKAALLLKWACTLCCEIQNTRLVQVPDLKTHHITALACQLS